jgi:uncharacterized protein YndB with AHSA1/START domain
MKGRHQLQRSLEILAPRDVVWAILEDSTLLPQWVPAVDEVLGCAPGAESVGSVRECRVNFAGRGGTIVERCVELVPSSFAAYVVDDDSLGFNRMFADYGFTFALEVAEAGRSTVRMDTYYTPRTVVTSVLNVLFMRRRFANTVDEILHGLAELAEERGAMDVPKGPTAAGRAAGTHTEHVANARAAPPNGDFGRMRSLAQLRVIARAG